MKFHYAMFFTPVGQFCYRPSEHAQVQGNCITFNIVDDCIYFRSHEEAQEIYTEMMESLNKKGYYEKDLR